jgi:hypothetical protein
MVVATVMVMVPLAVALSSAGPSVSESQLTLFG